MIDKLKSVLVWMNEKGIPVPMLRDPATGNPSVTLTLVFISSNVVLVGMLGKLANFFGGIDLTQAIYWNLLALGAYLGRRLTGSKPSVEETTKG